MLTSVDVTHVWLSELTAIQHTSSDGRKKKIHIAEHISAAALMWLASPSDPFILPFFERFLGCGKK